jgi:prophage regulatory protein
MAKQENSSAAAALPRDGFSRWINLEPLVGMSRETIRKRELNGQFPRRIYLTKRCAVWKNQELHRFFADPLNYRAEG